MRKLTLRDLFWLVLVAGILCGWWVDRSRQQRRHKAERDAAIEDALHTGYRYGKDSNRALPAPPYYFVQPRHSN